MPRQQGPAEHPGNGDAIHRHGFLNPLCPSLPNHMPPVLIAEASCDTLPATRCEQAFPTLRCRAIVVGLEGVDQVSVTGTQAGETLSEGWNGERLPGPG